MPTLLTVHDLSFIRDPDSAWPSLRAFLNQAVPRSVKRATHVLADSQATKADLIELLGTPAEKITVLYSGVEPRFAPVPDRAEIDRVCAKYHLPRPFILSVGTLQPRKNYGRLMQAFAQVIGAAGLQVDLRDVDAIAQAVRQLIGPVEMRERCQFTIGWDSPSGGAKRGNGF